MVQKNLGNKNGMCSIFKRSDPHAFVVGDIGKIHKGFTKQYHIITVAGPGNSLDRNYHYSIENDLNFIAQRDIKHQCGICQPF
jgi:hypothetical protein